MRKVMMLFVFAALISSVGMAAELNGAYISGGWGPETPENRSGENEPATNPDAACCQFTDTCTPGVSNYTGGDDVTVNSYWQETVDVDVNEWVVDFTAGVRLPNGRIVRFFVNEPIDFGAIPAGSYTFCITYTLTLPGACSGGATVTQGHGVTTPGGTLPAGQSDPNSNEDTWTCS